MAIPDDHQSENPEFDPDFSSPREIAAYYRFKNLNPIPAKGKRPAVDWKDYQNILVPQAVFEGWYNPESGTHKANGNVGTLLGRGKFMVDLDTYKPGGEAAQAWWDGLMAVHNNRQELETWEQVTGGGGRQLFFECPPTWRPPNVTTKIFVDVKGDGGFAMLPPSLHDASKKLYKWRVGRSPDDIPIMVAPQWLCEEIDRLDREQGGGKRPPFEGNGQQQHGAYNEWGRQYDGREDRLTRFVWGVCCDWRRECPIKPTLEEQRAKAHEKYAIWESLVEPQHPDASKTKTQLLDDENRGPKEFWAKFQRAMDQWEGKLKDDAAKPRPQNPDLDFEQQAKRSEDHAKSTGKTFELYDVAQIKAWPPPKWMIDKLVIEQSLGFIFGPPGSLKTFIALDIALSLATGQGEWWGYKIEGGGAVIYISVEGNANLPFRLKAWEQHRKINADKAPFYLIKQSINFLKAEDVGTLLATIEVAATRAKGPIAAIFVDTVSRVLPGAKENLQEDMTIFVNACTAVREKFGSVVFGIHHANAQGGIRGSTVIPAAGDFIIETRREPGALTGSIYAKKVKDGDDGWERFFEVKKLNMGDIKGSTSLAVEGIDEPVKTDEGGWPDKDTLRKILAAIAEQWFRKQPWCFAKNSPRSAVVNIMKRWRINRNVAEDILAEWTANEVIVHDVCDAKGHLTGYRKLTDI